MPSARSSSSSCWGSTLGNGSAAGQQAAERLRPPRSNFSHGVSARRRRTSRRGRPASGRRCRPSYTTSADVAQFADRRCLATGGRSVAAPAGRRRVELARDVAVPPSTVISTSTLPVSTAAVRSAACARNAGVAAAGRRRPGPPSTRARRLPPQPTGRDRGERPPPAPATRLRMIASLDTVPASDVAGTASRVERRSAGSPAGSRREEPWRMSARRRGRLTTVPLTHAPGCGGGSRSCSSSASTASTRASATCSARPRSGPTARSTTPGTSSTSSAPSGSVPRGDHPAGVPRLVVVHPVLERLLRDVPLRRDDLRPAVAVRPLPAALREVAQHAAVTTALALVGFSLYPLMPPRLLGDCVPQYGGCAGGYDFVDTLRHVGGLWSFDSGAMQRSPTSTRRCPACTSAGRCGAASRSCPRSAAASCGGLLIIYPWVTLFAIVVTANHYWIDAARRRVGAPRRLPHRLADHPAVGALAPGARPGTLHDVGRRRTGHRDRSRARVDAGRACVTVRAATRG